METDRNGFKQQAAVLLTTLARFWNNKNLPRLPSYTSPKKDGIKCVEFSPRPQFFFTRSLSIPLSLLLPIVRQQLPKGDMPFPVTKVCQQILCFIYYYVLYQQSSKARALNYFQIFLSIELKLQDALKSIRLQREKILHDSSSNCSVSLETSLGKQKPT